MRALILAAGLGSRLAPITDSIPKCMVAVNGKPILFQQIDCLMQYGVRDITVVSGYLGDVLETAAAQAYPDVEVVRNVDYERTNNMFSALLGLRRCGLDGPLVMMNADVFFDPEVVGGLLSYEAGDAVVVDVGRYLEESMKVVEKDGRLVRISKQVPPEDALGASIDVYKFSPAGLAAFEAACRHFIEERGELGLWSEVALDRAFADAAFRACPLSGRWFEIDDLDDLAAAESLFGGAR